MSKIEYEKLNQIVNGGSNQESWVELNMQNWVESAKVSQIVSKTRYLLKNVMKMLVWCLQTNVAWSGRFFSGSGKGIYVDIALTLVVFGQY